MNEFIKSLSILLSGNYSISTRTKQGNFEVLPHDYVGVRVIFENDQYLQDSLEKIIDAYDCKHVKDYREKSWNDGYQSVHIDVEINGVPIEIQLRTVAMDKHAQELILKKGQHYWHKKS